MLRMMTMEIVPAQIVMVRVTMMSLSLEEVTTPVILCSLSLERRMKLRIPQEHSREESSTGDEKLISSLFDPLLKKIRGSVILVEL